LASDIILRYDGNSFNYVHVTSNGAFKRLGISAIDVDGQTHQVNLVFCPDGVVILEDGVFIAQWRKSISSTVEPIFNWQILDEKSCLNAAFSGILTIPSTFAQTVQTPWDIALTSKWTLPNDIWDVKTEPSNPIPATYEPDYMRVATDSLSKADSTVYPTVAMALVEPVGLVTYHMRINASGGKESNITTIGDNILRITDDGKTVVWTRFTSSGGFEKLSSSTIKVGSGNFTDVTVIYSPNMISLFENAVYKVTRSYSESQQWAAWCGCNTSTRTQRFRRTSHTFDVFRWRWTIPPPARLTSSTSNLTIG
jgi:hypothetical protein